MPWQDEGLLEFAGERRGGSGVPVVDPVDPDEPSVGVTVKTGLPGNGFPAGGRKRVGHAALEADAVVCCGHEGTSRKLRSMANDAKAIRDTIRAWLKASKEGDHATLATFLADDMKFIVAGQPAFGKKEFFAGGGGRPFRFKSKLKVREVNLHGDWAQTWVELELEIVPAKGMKAMKLAGPAMTVWKKNRGRWQIWRDANMVGPKS